MKYLTLTLIRRIVLTFVTLTACAYGAARFEALYKVSRLGPTDVAVSCLSGGEPRATKVGSTVVLSCPVN